MLAALVCMGSGIAAPAPDDAATAFAGLATYSERQGVQPPDALAPVLAGLLVDGRDVPVGIPVLTSADGSRSAVALLSLARALDLEVREDDTRWTVVTPLGEATIARSESVRVDGIDYVWTERLSEALASDVRFDSSEYAVVVQQAWRDSITAADGELVRPDADARPAAASLSYWRTEANYLRRGDTDSTSASTDLGGRLGPGFWRVRHLDDFAGNSEVRDYAWVGTFDRQRLLLGHQRVQTHSLLNSFDLTGAQYAWTNRPEALFSRNLQYGELVASRVSPIRNLRGLGPPGGTAELRIDGRPVARSIIALDGRYEFLDVEVFGGSTTRVEVAVFERGEFGAPERIDDYSGSTSDQLLPRGALVHYLGAGQLGNALDPDDSLDGSAGFYDVRYGLSETLTLNAAAQQLDGRRQSLVGTAVGIAGLGVITAHAAESEGANGFQLLGDGRRGDWFWRAQWRDEEQGFRNSTSLGLSDQYAELGRSGSGWFVSLIGRRYDDAETGEVSFVKPAFGAQLMRGLYLAARPDREGEYGYQASWQARPDLRFSAYASAGRRQYDADYRLNSRWRLTAGRAEDFDGDSRNSLIAYRQRLLRTELDFAAGVLQRGSDFGYLFDVGRELIPGLSFRAQLSDDPLQRLPGGGSDPTLQVSLVADFAVTTSGLSRGTYQRGLQAAGGVAGTLRLPDGEPLAGRYSVGQTAVRVDGQVAGYLDNEGRYHIDNLKPGVHHIEIDEGELPLELSFSRRERWAEVVAGAVTAVDFDMDLQLGFAGRITRADGEPAERTPLQVVDEQGEVVASVLTDDWGYYRVDGLPPGRYRLQLPDLPQPFVDDADIELIDQHRLGVDRRLLPGF